MSPIATELEIKAAYRARALECHPDKFVGQGQAAAAQAEQSFKLLGEALEVPSSVSFLLFFSFLRVTPLLSL